MLMNPFAELRIRGSVRKRVLRAREKKLSRGGDKHVTSSRRRKKTVVQLAG